MDADTILDGGHRLISGLGDVRHLGSAVSLHADLADKVSQIRLQSGRITAVDVDERLGHNFRIISVYAPHLGYGEASLQLLYTTLSGLAEEARSAGKRVIIGGDFNTQLIVGVRSESMGNFASEHHLSITADGVDLPWDRTWTFRSSLGNKRQLDYVHRQRLIRTERCLFWREREVYRVKNLAAEEGEVAPR